MYDERGCIYDGMENVGIIVEVALEFNGYERAFTIQPLSFQALPPHVAIPFAITLNGTPSTLYST